MKKHIIYIGFCSFVLSFAGCNLKMQPISEIGDGSFEATGFTGTLTFEEGIERIKSWAFGNTHFTGGLEFPDSLREIGDGAFTTDGYFTIN